MQDRCGLCGSEVEPNDVARGKNAAMCRACVTAGMRHVLASTRDVRDGQTTPNAYASCRVCSEQTPPALLYVPAERDAGACAMCLHEASSMLTQLSELRGRRLSSFDRANAPVADLVAEHFEGLAPEAIFTLGRTFPKYVRVDLDLALGALFASARSFGLRGGFDGSIDYSKLLERGLGSLQFGPLQYDEVDVGEDEPRRCLRNCLWLDESAGVRFVVVFSARTDVCGNAAWHVDIAVAAGDAGDRFVRESFAAIETALETSASYRGKIVSLENEENFRGLTAGGVKVHRLPPVPREEIILGARTLQMIDRSVVGFVKHRDRLRALGMSTKRGLLFYGPPGTGKTYTVRYLAGQLRDHTTLLVTAEQMGLLDDYMRLARLLSPSIVLIEDVDLIARRREDLQSVGQQVALNQLLNEMDGLREEAEILFILTTNKPAELEGALAARPGRIDQAIEFPVPDGEERRRLFELYRRSMAASPELVTRIVQRTAGVSAAFLKELARKIAQVLAERGADVPTVADVDQALAEMLFDGGRLNATLLGVDAALTGY